MYIDAHCHLHDQRFADDLSTVVASSRAAGVSGWMLGGVDPPDWSRARQLAGRFTGVRWSAGLHPVRVASMEAAAVEAALAALPAQFVGPWAAAAVGEIGLDRVFASRDSLPGQRTAFERQLGWALDRRLPVVLHIVGAHGMALEVLEKRGPIAGVVHACSAHPQVVLRYLKLGLHIGFAASVLRAERVAKAARLVPSDRLLVETDAPDQSPQPGQRNSPARLLMVARAVADARGVGAKDVLRLSARNAEALFGPFWPAGLNEPDPGEP